MPDLLFLVHGMGLSVDQWHQPFVDALEEQYAKYPNLAEKPFDERFTVIPVSYDDRLRQIVKRWQDDAEGVGKAAADVDARLVQDMTGWLKLAASEDHYEWTHAADVLLYRMFPSVHEHIKVHVGSQIATAVNKRKAGENWSVLGYSLGTAVAHDSLHALWTDKVEGGTGFAADQERALVVAQIANVSRILQTKPKVYESAVKPGSASQKRGCRYFLTARHRLDPFTSPSSFDPVNWPDATAEQRRVFTRPRLEHIHQWNVHGFEHYLAHPAVHIPLFRMLMDDREHLRISDEEENDAHQSFKPFGDLEKAAALKIKSWLDDRLPAVSDSWDVLKSVWDWYSLGKQHFA